MRICAIIRFVERFVQLPIRMEDICYRKINSKQMAINRLKHNMPSHAEEKACRNLIHIDLQITAL